MSTLETPGDAPASDEQTTAVIDEAPAPAPAKKAKGRGLREWFWRSAALADADRVTDEASDGALIQEAREYVELADRLTARIDVLQSGSGLSSAILLYREALVLAAASQRAAEETDAGLRAHRMLEGAAPGEAARSADTLLAATPARTARMSEQERATQAGAARALLRLAMDAVDRKQRSRGRVLFQRTVRTGALAIFVVGTAASLAAFIPPLLRPANLLAHSPWHASSTYPGFSPDEGTATGKHTQIFFHTDQEYNPFIQFDMGKVQTLRHFEIQNRHDCCDDRALPLVIEISVDGKRFDEVARRTEPFKTFDANIPPKLARFVKVHVPKKTWLHLERVAAW
jgi:hypothetical protein